MGSPATFCRTTLQYASPTGPLIDPRGGIEVEVRDGRTADLPGWQQCGFELLAHAPHVADWTDDEEIADVHYAEVEALARELTGADAALVSDHVKRSADSVRRPREQTPVRLVHSDFSDDYGDVVRFAYRDVKGRGAATLARSGLTAEQIEAAPRIVMMQFWRNLGAPKMDLPVAFCDARTLTRKEVRPFPYTGYVAGGRSFDALAITAPDDGRAPAHGWYVFPEMTIDEVVAFRTYDTELVARQETYFTPHSAIRDPDVDIGKPARFSIELRVLCLFL